jgi:HAD superfamily hydrolase (TIGR01509 family)
MEKKLVIFDLGRVLVRICDSWRHACEVVGIEGVNWRELDPVEQARLVEVIHDFDTGAIDLQTFAERTGQMRGLTREQVIAISNGYLLGPFPGAGELLDELNRAGHVTACLSNTNANHWKVLMDPADAHGKVLARLRHQFASHLMRVRKPSPEIYAQVERETGFSGDRIIFFDDLPENIAAAEARGWKGYVVPVGENPIPAIRGNLKEAGVL